MADSEYRWGTHELATREGQFKGTVWRSSPGTQGSSLQRPAIFAAPQLLDLTQQGSLFHSAQGIQGPSLRKIIQGAPQLLDMTLQATFVPSARTPQIIPNPVIKSFFAAPAYDLTQQGSIYPTVPAASGWILTMITAGPQILDMTPASQAFRPSLPTVAQPPIAAKQIYSAPQLIDLTQQGWIETPPTQLHGPVPPLTQGAPQLADLTQQGVYFPLFPTPPQPGTVINQIAAPPQPDLNINYSLTWTPSVLSPSSQSIDTSDPGLPKRWPETQVIRQSELDKKLKKKGRIERADLLAEKQTRVGKSTAIELKPIANDDDEIFELMAKADDELFELVEKAIPLIRKLH